MSAPQPKITLHEPSLNLQIHHRSVSAHAERVASEAAVPQLVHSAFLLHRSTTPDVASREKHELQRPLQKSR